MTKNWYCMVVEKECVTPPKPNGCECSNCWEQYKKEHPSTTTPEYLDKRLAETLNEYKKNIKI